MEISLNKLLKLQGAQDQGIAMSMLHMMVSKIMPLAEQQLASVLETIENAPCAQAMGSYMKSLFNKSPSSWALRMLDSTAKVPQGLLTGSWALLGDFDECVSTRAPSFHGQYCLMTACVAGGGGGGGDGDGGGGVCSGDHLESPQWEQLAQGRLPAPWRGSWLATLAAAAQGEERLPLHVGVCVPSSCTPADVTAMAARVAQVVAPQAAAGLHFETSSCQMGGWGEFDTADFLALTLIFGLILIVAASTAYDYATRGWRSRRARVLLALSAARNGTRLLETAEARPDALPGLAALRALSVLWVAVHHALLTAARLPLGNGQSYLKELQRASAALATGGFLGLDTLLLLDGLLLSYAFLRRSAAGRRFSLAAHYAHHAARFLPSLALVLFLQSTIFLKLGDGPLWDMQPSQQCTNTWPYILFQVCNYFRPNTVKCMAHAWFLSLQWQLCAAAPLVLLLLRGDARRVQWALAAAAAAGVGARFALAFAYGLHAPWGSHYTKDALKILYFPTHVRFMPYFLGIILGYELHRMKHLEMPNRLSQKMMCMLQLLWPILLTGSLVSVHKFSVPSDLSEPFFEALHLASVHTMWALGVAIFVFLAATGTPTPGLQFLSLGEWRPLGRLARGIFLLHVPFLNLLLQDARFALHLSVWRQMAMGLMTFGLMVVPAAVLWLLLEAPMGQLAALLCDPPKGVSRNFKQLCLEIREFLLQVYRPFLDPAYGEVESETEMASTTKCIQKSAQQFI